MRGLLLLSLLLCACGEEESADSVKDQGSIDLGVLDSGPVEKERRSFIFTSMTLEHPSAAAPIINQLLNTFLNDGRLYLFVQLIGWDSDEVQVRGGAGQIVAGEESSEPSDDRFSWLTEGECLNPDGEIYNCEVEIGEGSAKREGNHGEVKLSSLNIYVADLKVIFPIRALEISCALEGSDLGCHMAGSISQEEAQEAHFSLVPGGPRISLERLMQQLGLEPDTQVEGPEGPPPADMFSGPFEATEAPFEE